MLQKVNYPEMDICAPTAEFFYDGGELIREVYLADFRGETVYNGTCERPLVYADHSDPYGSITHYFYDAAGRRTFRRTIDDQRSGGEERVWQYIYDDRGELTETLYFENGVQQEDPGYEAKETQRSYDEHGNLTEIKNDNSCYRFENEYDETGLLIAVEMTSGEADSYRVTIDYETTATTEEAALDQQQLLERVVYEWLTW